MMKRRFLALLLVLLVAGLVCMAGLKRASFLTYEMDIASDQDTFELDDSQPLRTKATPKPTTGKTPRTTTPEASTRATWKKTEGRDAEKVSWKKTEGTDAEKASLPASTPLMRTKSTAPDPHAKIARIFDLHNVTLHHYDFSVCEFSRCELTENSLDADLIMVQAAKMKNRPIPPRKPGALLVFYTKEPPTFRRFRFLNRTEVKGAVNWTRCVFKDSTFRAYYSKIIRRTAPHKDYDEIFRRKRKSAAWFASHCVTHSRREEYIARMAKEIPVDIYGKCGNLTCGHHGFAMGGEKQNCSDMLSQDYKFYLSFENSMCLDYITEKFFNMFEDVDVIPVVRGGGSYGDFVPRGTYINSEDFGSPEELGRYLRRLGANKKLYTDMLRKKKMYVAVPHGDKFHCQLCEALHTRRHVPSVFPDFHQWMWDHCWEPDDL